MLCCLALTFVAGCGGSSKPTASKSTTTTATHTTVIHGIKERYAKPASPGPHPGAKIKGLIVKDVRKGTGDEIHAGDTGLFDFIATNYVTGRAMESSWNRRRAFETRVEHGVVIDGWWQGIPGMRVAGERRLIIPPSLGFTTNPDPEVQRATTYFDVVLLGVIPAQAPGVGGNSGGGQGAAGGGEVPSNLGQ